MATNRNDRIITREELDRQLWGAADILRGSTDAGDFKNYIFDLVFLKRLNDVFLERREDVIASYVADGMSREEAEEVADDPDEYGDGAYFVPPESRWDRLIKTPENRAEAIDTALERLQEANSQYFDDILTTVRFNDERRFGGAPDQHDAFMSRLLTHFNALPLGNRNLIDPDILGESYEYLIDRFADGAGKKGGEYRTPPMVVRTIVEIVKPTEGMRIHDPTCGSGGMLIGSGRYVEDHGGNEKNLTLTGQEKNYNTWAIGKLNMLLHNFPDGDIQLGDTILNPKFTEAARLTSYDRILANPPFSLKEWHGVEAKAKKEGDKPKVDRTEVVERWQSDVYSRFGRGIPPTTKGDTAFLQHMVEACSDDGMVGVVMPHGVLFRGGSEGAVRQKLLEEDLFEAVIGLPSNLFYGTGIPASILILNKAKPKARKKQVLFIDASSDGLFHEGKARNTLRWQDVLRIASGFESWDKPEKLIGIADRIAGEWITASNMHRDRQLERCTTDELRETITKTFAAEVQQFQQAAAAVKDWYEADQPGGRSAWDKFARVVTLEEIADENGHNLNISRYVDSSDPPPQLDVKVELAKLRELETKRNEAESRMDQLLKELGYGS
ncbi:type I restriction-modification system subunit M [Rhodopirellula sp. JC740]|uniref:site-specific DNA-methyltransferase (adenine-specific) n=1 Tax=Rhodopirellula halodulae TaxID=2894198 RepID=A0ABS8NHI2_9BACT|nr:class I SAM-dependent DNA methyltransferase [Rhodopirellula sp. JC740]MCC9643009.1 type I restriction-modification system subunit M [Rhodopirellula sp. JC740]